MKQITCLIHIFQVPFDTCISSLSVSNLQVYVVLVKRNFACAYDDPCNIFQSKAEAVVLKKEAPGHFMTIMHALFLQTGLALKDAGSSHNQCIHLSFIFIVLKNKTKLLRLAVISNVEDLKDSKMKKTDCVASGSSESILPQSLRN